MESHERADAPASSPPSPSHGVAAALQMHQLIDELALTGQAGSEVLATVLSSALTMPDLAQRTALTLRLRTLLHEGLAESVGSPAAMEHWESILQKHKSFRDTQPSCLAETSVVGAEAVSDDVWGKILRYVVSLEALAKGICAVCRGFRRSTLQPDCWQDRDVTLHEHHFQEAFGSGKGSWLRPLGLLSTWAAVRTVRIAGFEDCNKRKRVLPTVSVACQTLCPHAKLLTCSFCCHYIGEQVELPSPRKLTARRRLGDRVEDKGGGLLLGCGPLCESGVGRYFALRVERLASAERLDIGVTSLPPHVHFKAKLGLRKTVFAEDLASSWIIESSGLLVGSHAGVRIRDGRWNARLLRAGDELGLLVTAAGELALHVNGTWMAEWRAQIPTSAELYPVIDLFEGTPTVCLLPDAVPPEKPPAI
eukprot:gnl/TRDRNA2_/TRDRNA2_168037_c0_seq1.p1 gnl/TRDRNA2_/TRDRNA2_168037_c0~~gnl/TRDRNA2_/TRDRNA2_168037_c0_seq1.p1  ORF type:complete len:421 (-),score=72.14 gnl/TRDRNA2_/TRDRNA2_168037_c0_seq1:85-1347(-)